MLAGISYRVKSLIRRCNALFILVLERFMRISTPDSVRTAVLLLRYLVEVIDATIFRGAPSAAFRFTCASVALRTDIICAAGAIFSALLEESDAIRHSVPRAAEIHPPRSRPLSLALALRFVPISWLAEPREREQVARSRARSPACSIEERTNRVALQEPSCVFAEPAEKKLFSFPSPFRRRRL